jgi:hypothetical protein
MRDLSKGHIKLLEQVYTLQLSENKRELIFNKNNELVNTKPYKIYNLKISN